MRAGSFSVEITLDVTGVLSVRILGKDWDQGAKAHALLQRLNPLIRELDAEAKRRDIADHAEDDELVQ